MVCECYYQQLSQSDTPKYKISKKRYSANGCGTFTLSDYWKIPYEELYFDNYHLKRSKAFIIYSLSQYLKKSVNSDPFSIREVNSWISGFKEREIFDSLLQDIRETNFLIPSLDDIPFEFSKSIINNAELLALLLFISDVKSLRLKELNKEFETLTEEIPILLNKLERFNMIKYRIPNIQISLLGELTVLKLRKLRELNY